MTCWPLDAISGGQVLAHERLVCDMLLVAYHAFSAAAAVLGLS